MPEPLRKQGILNSELLSAVSAMGHTDYCVIADAGLPVPKGVRLIDLSLVRGTPSFEAVLAAVCDEMTCESYLVAIETGEKNLRIYDVIRRELADLPCRVITHEQLKEQSRHASFIVRTGECTPFSNVILVSSAGF